jgi:hypothetical protein
LIRAAQKRDKQDKKDALKGLASRVSQLLIEHKWFCTSDLMLICDLVLNKNIQFYYSGTDAKKAEEIASTNEFFKNDYSNGNRETIWVNINVHCDHFNAMQII